MGGGRENQQEEQRRAKGVETARCEKEMRSRGKDRRENKNQIRHVKKRVIAIRQQAVTEQKRRRRDELMLVVIHLSSHRSHEKQKHNREQAGADDRHPKYVVSLKAITNF